MNFGFSPRSFSYELLINSVSFHFEVDGSFKVHQRGLFLLQFLEPPVGAVLGVFVLSCFVHRSTDTVSAALSRSLLQLLCYFVLELDGFNLSPFKSERPKEGSDFSLPFCILPTCPSLLFLQPLTALVGFFCDSVPSVCIG